MDSCTYLRKRGISCRFGAIVGLQFLTQASFGFMSPIISILTTEVLGIANLVVNSIHNDRYQYLPDYNDGLSIDCGASPQNQACVDGSREAAWLSRTGGVMNAAAADIVSPDNRATAFGLLYASIAVGYCSSAFIAPFFNREHILRIAVGIFVLRVVWAMLILHETLPARTRINKTLWVLENPFSSISILFSNKLFVALTCLIALTSFVSEGIFQIQSFYLNIVVGFDVMDFGNLILFNGVLAIIGQGLLLDPLMKCIRERGVIIMALIGCFLKTFGFNASVNSPFQLMSINTSDKEQGRLQGGIYGVRSVFAAMGPVVFSLLYTAMTKKSEWSQAFPFVVASCCYFIGMCMAITLPVDKDSTLHKIASEINDDNGDKVIEGIKIDRILPVSDDDQSLMEPLLSKSTTRNYQVVASKV